MDFPLPAVIRHTADQFLAKVGAGYPTHHWKPADAHYRGAGR